MTNQPNKAAVKDGLPTAHNVLSDAYQRRGWLFQPDVLPSGACPHEKIAMDAMQEYASQQTETLTDQISDLEHENSEYRTVYDSVVKSRDELRQENERLRGLLSDCVQLLKVADVEEHLIETYGNVLMNSESELS